MARRAGYADLPLHGGRVPQWLADRMTRLGAVMAEAIVLHYGRDELLRRLAHPFWFQSFGAVMGMDWHSSGITTSVIGALKRGLEPLSGELGLHVCGGRGKHSRRTPDELTAIGERVGFDGAAPDIGGILEPPGGLEGVGREPNRFLVHLARVADSVENGFLGQSELVVPAKGHDQIVMRALAVRVQLQGFSQRFDGLREITLFAQASAKAMPVLGGIGPEFDGPSASGDGAVPIIEPFAGQAQVRPGVDMAGIDLDSPLENVARLGQTIGLSQADAKVVENRDVVRRQRQDLAINVLSLSQLAGGLELLGQLNRLIDAQSGHGWIV